MHISLEEIKDSKMNLSAFQGESIGVLDTGKHVAIHSVDIFNDSTAVSLSNDEALNFAHRIIEVVSKRKREGKN